MPAPAAEKVEKVEKVSSLLCTAVAALVVTVPAAVGWTAYRMAKTQAEVEHLQKELQATRAELAQVRQEEPLKMLAGIIQASQVGSKVVARWENLQEKW